MGAWLAFPLPAQADYDDDVVYPLIFPVQGPTSYGQNSFGACRDGCKRRHEGIDMMTYGQKGIPVVAAADGTVGWVHDRIGDNCCAFQLKHDDGWSTVYIHLNNDRQNPDGSYSDDGLGYGLASEIKRGARIKAGQLVGWVGDSGNAENTAPHLHFELRRPDGKPVNPYWSLVYAGTSPSGGTPPCANGKECDTVGIHYASGMFKIWHELAWGSSTSMFIYGRTGDIALSGDWDGDGVDTVGLYRQSNGFVYLKDANKAGNADITFYFGRSGDVPLVGDWDGDGKDTVSVYRPSEGKFFIKNDLEDGWAEQTFVFGRVGDKPFAGDFDGDGRDSIGLHRESTGLVYFRNELSEGWADAEFIYGKPGDVLVAGDWDGDGKDTVGVYRPSTGLFYVRNKNSAGNADYTMFVGRPSEVLAFDLND